MVWNSQNLSFIGSPNYAAYSGPNYAAYSGPNYAAYSAPNYAVYSGPNYAAYSAPNYAAYSSPNYAAMPEAGMPPASRQAPPLVVGAGTGAGGASGTGFLGGYGPVARFEYATPAALGPLPWILDFANGDEWPPFPTALRLNPKDFEWQTSDWDPALRFWDLPFDPHLTEWLQDLNMATPAVMAAREFAAHHLSWKAIPVDQGRPLADTIQSHFENQKDYPGILKWRTDSATIDQELNELVDLMGDDRARYLEETSVQSGQATPYIVHLMGFDPAAKPWTMELMNCAAAIGNLVKMQYKSCYRRVRPSFLCAGLAPPWGPPQHPAFPSGHSTVTHLTVLFLLSVPGIAQRFGIFDKETPGLVRPPNLADFKTAYGQDQRSPLLWLAWRIAKGRERLGLHYSSDSAAGRVLAALVWDACLGDQEKCAIKVSTLRSVRARAAAEWPELT